MVGDLAETIALILPPATGRTDIALARHMADLVALAGRPAPERRAHILAAWDSLGDDERFLFNKLITGGFRMGVSQGLMTRALAAATGIDAAVLAHRLMGGWTPGQTSYAALVETGDGAGAAARPYPFALAAPLDQPPEALGPPGEWIAEWKWDGIRGQMIHRPGAFALWSRGEELLTDRFPECAVLADFLPPGTVIDGELLVWGDDRPQPFSALQRRIGRKTVPTPVAGRSSRADAGLRPARGRRP